MDKLTQDQVKALIVDKISLGAWEEFVVEVGLADYYETTLVEGWLGDTLNEMDWAKFLQD